MPSDNKYSIDIIWSVQDNLYLAQVKELPGCLADGATAQEALQNLLVVRDEWLETAKEENREIPAPVTLEALEKAAQLARQQLQTQVENSVRNTVIDILEKMEAEKPSRNFSGLPEANVSRFRMRHKEKA
jgi:predicted RNase H-like HicB family nuclease